MITVKNLIEILACYPMDLKVVVDGYEGDLDDLVPRLSRCIPGDGLGLYMGEHREIYESIIKQMEDSEVKKIVDVLVLSGQSEK